MSNIIQMKNKIFSVILPMTTIKKVNLATEEVMQEKLDLDHPESTVTKIGFLPFEIRIDEIASLCENGIKSIDSWFDYLKNNKIWHIENIVHQSKVQAAREQAKAAKWTFYTQLGFMILSVLFIIVSFCLAEYKKDWISLFTNKQKIDQNLFE